MLSGKKGGQGARYLEIVTDLDSPEIKRLYTLKNPPFMLGGAEFKERIKEKFSHIGLQENIPHGIAT